MKGLVVILLHTNAALIFIAQIGLRLCVSLLGGQLIITNSLQLVFFNTNSVGKEIPKVILRHPVALISGFPIKTHGLT